MDGNPLLDRWEEVDTLFSAALDLPEDEREAFVRDATRGDEELLHAVLSLLESSEQTEGFLEHPHLMLDAELLQESAASAGLDGQQVGPYRLLEEIGRGGTGAVFRAERADGAFEQRVAVKLLRRGLDTDDILQRFRAERQILASLNHPNIARLLDGGATEDGRPYLVMELVEGLPITDHCDRHRLSVEDRMRLFATVGRAVQYAHRNLVVHRDLKPSNILVTADGTVKLLDFGIAKLLDDSVLSGTTPYTRTGLRLMTPEYASPEQVGGEAVTTASDVYQLGVLLYELLAGQRPYELRRRSPGEMERVILTQQPLPPSALATRQREVEAKGLRVPGAERLARWRGSDVRRLRSRLRGDLDTITLMALRKESERRYASAAALVDDVERHLEGRPVSARLDTWGYRTRKFAQRNPGGAMIAVLALIAAGGYVGTLQAHAERLERERNLARVEMTKSERVTDFLLDLFRAADPIGSSQPLTPRDLVDRGAARVEQELGDDPPVQARLIEVLGQVYRRLGEPDEAERLLERSLEIRTALYAGDHLEVASALAGLGALRTDQGDYSAAAELLGEALAMKRRLLGSDDPRVTAWIAESLHNLARVQIYVGEPGAAELLFREALAINRALGKERERNVASNLTSLGTVLSDTRRFDEAEAMLREALTIRRTSLGDEHPGTAVAMNNLGLMLNRQGRNADAEPLLRQSLAIRRQTLGPGHPAVAVAVNNLALALDGQERFDEAESLYRESLELRRAHHGETHPVVATALHNLGAFYLRIERMAEAEEYLRLGITGWQRTLGDDHPHVIRGKARLARVLSHRGDFAEAERLLQEALAAHLGSHGDVPDSRAASLREQLEELRAAAESARRSPAAGG